jgi:hypothetical protein
MAQPAGILSRQAGDHADRVHTGRPRGLGVSLNPRAATGVMAADTEQNRLRIVVHVDKKTLSRIAGA